MVWHYLRHPLDLFRAHPYATAATLVVGAELLRSRDCPTRSTLTSLVTLGAVGATINAGAHAAGAATHAAIHNAFAPYPVAPAPNPAGVAAGLPVVQRDALPHGAVADALGLRRGAPPARVAVTSGRARLGAGHVLVHGRADRVHVVDRACRGAGGIPGRALATGGHGGCQPRGAGRVLGLKSWYGAGSATAARHDATLRNLEAAFRARGLPVPQGINQELRARARAETQPR
jgi:hypothetical protein